MRVDGSDFLVVIGLVMFCGGLYLLDPALVLVGGGGFLMLLGLVGAVRKHD